MKILYIMPSIPNEFSRIRTLNLLKSFKENGCKVDVIALYSNKKELKQLNNNEPFDNITVVKYSKMMSYINCFIGLFLPIPLQNMYVFSIKLHRILSKIDKNKYDLIYIKRLRMAGYAKHFDKNKTYIDLTDSLTKYYERAKIFSKGISKLLNMEEYIKHLKYEIKIAKQYNTIICSEDDKNYLENKHNTKLNNMKVIYNTIDTAKWYNKNPRNKNKKNKLVFSGVLDYFPNTIAAEFIINEIMPKLPNSYSITFVGKNVPNVLKKFESDRIHFTGYVDNMKQELQKYDIYLCPIFAGSGSKNKILQASLVGLPIITTHLGIEGLKKEIEQFVFTAENSNDFINQIKKISTLDISERVTKQQKFIIKFYDYKYCTKDLIK